MTSEVKSNEITDVEEVVEVWGEVFRDLVSNPKIHFFPNEIVVDLKNSIRTLEEASVTSIQIVEPTEYDLETTDSEKGQVAKARALLSATAGIADREIKKMKVSDFALVSQVISCFLPNVQ